MRQWNFVVGECISRFEALKRLLFKIFSKWNTALVIGCNRCVFFCGMDNSEKLTFDLEISGKNKSTLYLLEWRHGVCKGNNFCVCATGKLPCILLRQELFHVDKMELRVGRMVWNYNKVEEQLCENVGKSSTPPLLQNWVLSVFICFDSDYLNFCNHVSSWCRKHW